MEKAGGSQGWLPHGHMQTRQVVDRLAVISLVAGPFCPSRVTFNFNSSPERTPSYLLTMVWPLKSTFTVKEMLFPSIVPSEIASARGTAGA